MASTPLFDLSGIDLTAIAVSGEEVEQLNPQRGCMRQLDHVIWKSEDARRGLGVKYVRDDEFWVEGHVPGRPLLPGILMVEAAAQLCSALQRLAHGVEMAPGQFLGFTRCDKVAFRGQVVPGDTLHLLAVEIAHSRRRFISATQAMVGDTLVFEGEITGMVL